MLLSEFGPYKPKTRVSVKEDRESVAAAVARRIMGQRLDLIKTYGVDKVIAAIDDVADYVGDVEEIGTSDVSAWVREVERSLQSMAPQESAEPGVEESLRPGEHHRAEVTFDDGSKVTVKLPSDEGFRDQITQHFAKQGKKVKDIEVDWSIQSESADAHDSHGDLRASWLARDARRKFPMAKSNREAMAMWMADKELKDTETLSKVNDQEDQEIDRLETKVDSLSKRVASIEKQVSNESRSVTAEEVSKYLAEMKESGYDI